MRFEDIPGLSAVKQMLIQSVQSGKMAHAQLFTGKPGALNLPLALAYATYIHCQNRNLEDACGQCSACTKNLKYIHPDLHFVFPLSNIKNDKDADRFKAEIMKSWRSFLIEQPFGKLDDWTSYYGGENKQALISREESREIIKTLSLKSFESPYKIRVILLPEFMHGAAANGILKILEEPPQNTFFLLVTSAADQLLPTIISRTQLIQVPLLTDEDLDSYLCAHTEKNESARRTILQMADGDLNLAMKLTDEEENINHDFFSQWMRACYKKNYAALVQMAEEFHQFDKMNQKNTFSYSLGMMRESLLCLSGSTTINRSKGGELQFIQDFSKFLNVVKIERANQLLSDAAYYIERNGSPKMTFLNLSLQLSDALNS